MWTDYLWPEFRESIMLYVDVEHSPWETEEPEPTDEEIGDELSGVLSRMARWLKESTERYSIVIGNYEAIKTDLLAKVESTTSISGTTNQDTLIKTNDESIELRNDTPQAGGNYLSDPYVSEASRRTGAGKNTSSVAGASDTQSTTASDLTTPIERLEEIRQKLHNLYADWADEFARFVIYSAE